MNTKKEKLLYATYQNFMDQGLGRIMPDPLNEIVSEDAMGFGTTADEKIFGIEGFLKLIRIQKEQSEGLDMTWKIGPVSRYVNAEENLAVFADDIHLTVDVKSEKIKMYLRFSVVMEYTNNKWLVIHWHGSKPEDVQSEVDTFGIENWKQKVDALEKLVGERTADLVEKNRELEIETSLERVRARSMAMHNTSELQAVIHTVHNELLHLNIAIDGGSFIAINSDIESELRCWGSGGTAETTEEVHIPLYKKPFCTNLINRIKKGPGFFTEEYSPKEKKDFFTFLFKHQPWSKLNAKQKKETLSSPGGYTRSCCVSKHTSIFIINHHGEIFSAGDNEILQRFGKVFEQTYTRFLDLQKAEAQAREAEIELSLERVRARTMAMQHSDELLGTSKVVFDQLKNLGETAHQLSIGIVNEKDAVFDVFATIFGDQMIQVYHSKIDDPFVMGKVYKAWKVHQKSFVIKIKGKRLREYNITRNSIVKGMKVYPESIQPDDCWIVSCATFSAGIIAFSSDKEITNESFQLLERFAKVFEQTYTRFLDLQKAEAQAREAKIEVSLERVRSRAMAMHKTDELLDAGELVYKELTDLGITSMAVSYAFVNEQKKNALYYGINPVDGKIPPVPFVFPHTETEEMRSVLKSWKKREAFKMIELDEEATLKHQTWVGAHIQTILAKNNIPFSVDEFLAVSPQTAVIYTFHFKEGYIFIIGEERLSAMQEEIVLRFTKVFEMTYRRFLDLQKAEAQAKEANIEAALEKVRSRSLAMHKAEELGEVVLVIVEKIKELNIEMNGGVTLVTFEPGSKDFLEWHSNPGQIGETLTGLLSYFDHPVFNDCIKAIEQGVELLAKVYPKEEKDSYIDYLSAHTDYIPGDMVEWVHEQQYMGFSFAIQKHSGIFLQDYTDKFFSKEENDILIRFSRVFEQSYIRFLDLQKAEAQAKEAQIETALEKVRSRSLAMHKTDELQEVVTVVLERMTDLNIELDTININIFKEDSNELNLWTAAPGQKYAVPFHLPFIAHPFHTDIFTAKENGLDFFTKTYSYEEKNSYFNYTFEHSDFKYVPEAKKKLIMEGRACTRSMAITKNAGIIIIRYAEKPFSDSENEILKRFAKVFEQAYTRFLDLQKAEAQAREGQIELALEKVRARTMAMQHSDELTDASLLLDQQIRGLGIKTRGCAFNIYGEKESTEWFSNEMGTMQTYKTPREKVFLNYYEAGQKGETLLIKEFSGKECIDWYNYLCTLPIIGDGLKEMIANGGSFPTRQIDHVTYFKYGYLLFITLEPVPEVHDIFKRFAKVFEQTYTRFLDLQKAEAQARESKIELSLERVRAKTMAMHNSQDIGDTVATMFAEFVHLGIQTNRCGILIFNDEPIAEVWTAKSNPEGKANLIIGKLDMNVHALLNGILKAWEKKESFYTYIMEGDDLINYYQALNNLEYYPVKFDMNTLPSKEFHSDFYFPEGSVFTFTAEPIPNEASKVIKRFAAVFGQTYRRYLDLQKAEAQARESQIQLALERVRARTMAMQHSEDLQDTALLLTQQVKTLDIPFFACGFNIWDEDRKAATAWMAGEDRLQPPFKTSSSEDIFLHIHEAANRGEQLFVANQGDEELETHYRYLASIPAFREEMEKMSQAGLSVPTFQIMHCAFFSQGYLMFITYEPVPEAYDIFVRFAKVFEQTYTRFLDLQKAEAQAKEAQIEAALEKVRSRSMGMQKSEELKEVIKVVYEQFVHLNINVEHTGFIMDYKERDDMHIWLADQHLVPSEIFIPYFDSSHWNSFREAKEKGTDFFPTLLDFEEKNKFYKDLFALIPGIPEETIDYYFRCPGLAGSTVLLDNVSLYIENFQGIPYSDEENKILMRFGKVFQQTYTRFLDLQKAEAQTRKAHIEAALERTRTQSMIMQHSNELDVTLRVFHEQVLQLNIPSAFSFLWLPDEGKNKHLFWAIWEENKNDAIVFKDKAINYPLDRNEPATAQCLIDWKTGEPVYSYAVQPEAVETYFATWHELIDGVEKLKPEFFPGGLYYVEAFMKYGCFGVMVETDLIDEEKKILYRFAVEFERTYARFLDLQKAEAQAREAQIELGLERVRARAMAMQHSNELSQLVDTVFKELANLDFALNWCIINIIDEPSLTNIVWAANPETNKPPESYLMKFEDYPFHHSMMRGYQERKTKHVYVLEGKEKKEYDEYLFNKTEWRRVPKKAQAASRAMKSYVASFTFSNFGGLQTVGEESLSEESLDILHRFGKVFDSTYTRFNDLQKAEAQAREAKIEAALERVRSRTMAMQRSDELPEAANLLFQQIQALGIPAWSAGYCIWEDNKKAITLWMSSEGVLQPPARAPLTEDPSFIHMREAYEKGESFHVEAIGGDELVQHYQYMRTLPVVGDMLDSIIEAGHPLPTFQIFHCVYFSQGFLLFITYEPVPDAHDIFKRFGKVFDQTYTRFLDLQKAEAQVREAQIEAGLERVRSRSMAMHSSDELVDTSDTLFVEVKKLGLDVIRTGVGIFNGPSDTLEIWSRFENNESNKRKILGIVTGAAHPQIDKWIKAWKSRLPYFSFTLVGDEVKEYYETMSSYLTYPTQIDYNAQETISAFFFPEGSLNIVSYNFLKEAECNIMIRFATVFGQVYQRFLDLQKAEAQARESQIEAALERVRSRMMSMHRSDELSETAAHLFAQLNQLGIKPYRCNIVIVDKAHDTCKIWATTNKGVVIPLFASFPLTETPSFAHMYDAWKNNEKRQVLKLIGEERVIHTKYISQFSTITEYKPGEVDFDKIANEAAVFSNFFFKQGFLFIHTIEEMSEANMNIIQRFTNVFEQTYTRFLDLQKAETQAREAQIEAALEKVRSRTLAMQNSDELADTSIVIFEQLIHLGIEPNRLFIGIINNETAAIEAWATNEDGTKIGNHFTLNTQKNESVKKMYEGWKENKTSITIDLTGKELQNYFHYLSDEMQIPFKGGLSQKRRIQTIAYFGQGLIGMASPEDQPKETTQLLERFAAVFNLTYTRFNDLKIAEAHALQAEEDLVKLQTEKRRAEDALINLQAAQKQLVQSEKMASLGELTAGIAHEIQNPLNFVNNFSEVSKELLDEMKEEMEKGHLEDVKQIMQDVIQNLEKINLHGKRADGIVKGMLQHSQSSKGQKEPTDINALCDEYLRLSYHGLRAKDKSFNADFKTDFDKSIGKINIIPQEIGRVILNLINNAFYAVAEKKTLRQAQGGTSYQPTVSISTKKIGDKVEIKVSDNGSGIPQAIVDKIFQPFFTTKPTGQGTGLGLSLSYDIIKAHGGEIKVETREGEGSTFIIYLSTM